MNKSKKYIPILIAALSFSASAFAASEADTIAVIKKNLEAGQPGMVLPKISKAPIDGLYQFYDGGRMIYTDSKGKAVILGGTIIDAKTKENLTIKDMKEATKIDFSTLPLADAMKTVKGNGKNLIAVFSDPDCPYCKRLEKEVISKLTNHTIYTFYFPLDMHPEARGKSIAAWCSPDKQKVWNDMMLSDIAPKADKSCDHPIDRNMELAKKLNVSGTPTIFYGDGTREFGAPNVEKMNAM